MLKRVKISDVELGMFVHKLEGSWFKHPFWKSRFLLEEADMLADLRASELSSVIIDTSKGRDLRPRTAGPALTQAPQPTSNSIVRPALGQQQRRFQSAPAASSNSAELRSTTPHSMGREFGLASRVVGRSQKVVSKVFLESRLGKSIKTAEIEPVIEDIFSSIQRQPHAFNGLMRCKRDIEQVYRHALSMSALMITLARQMKLSPDAIRQAGMAGLLKDVGIALVPDNENGQPTDLAAVHDADRTCDHTILGHDYLKLGGDLPEGVLEATLQHHERLDGSGYPQHLQGDDIGIMARMAAICDVYDDLVTDHQSHPGIEPSAAIEELLNAQGKFDPAILKQFIDALGIYPIGSVVRLRTNRLALVVNQDPADGARPLVRVFYSIGEKRLIRPQDIALAQCFGEDAIEGAADPAVYGIADFPQLRERLFAAAAKADL